MTTTTRPARTVLATLLLAAFVAAACGAGAAPSAPPSSDPSPSVDPGPAIQADALVAAAAQHDGTVVRATGFFLVADGVAQLCSVVLESYPPQCGDGTLRITGEVPAAVLAALDSTNAPDLAQARWGWVEVVGTFRAQGASGAPTIELTSIEIVQP